MSADKITALIVAAQTVVDAHEQHLAGMFKLLEPASQKAARARYGAAAAVGWMGDPDIVALKHALDALREQPPIMVPTVHIPGVGKMGLR